MRSVLFVLLIALLSGACTSAPTVLVSDEGASEALGLSEAEYSVESVDTGEVLDLILEPLRGLAGMNGLSGREVFTGIGPDCPIRTAILDTGWGTFAGGRSLFVEVVESGERTHPSISVRYGRFAVAAEPVIPRPKPGESCWIEPLEDTVGGSVVFHTEALETGLASDDEKLHVRYLEFNSGMVARIAVPQDEVELLESLSDDLVAAHDANINRVRLCHGDPDAQHIPNVYGPCEEAGVFGRGPERPPRSGEPEVDVRSAPSE